MPSMLFTKCVLVWTNSLVGKVETLVLILSEANLQRTEVMMATQGRSGLTLGFRTRRVLNGGRRIGFWAADILI